MLSDYAIVLQCWNKCVNYSSFSGYFFFLLYFSLAILWVMFENFADCWSLGAQSTFCHCYYYNTYLQHCHHITLHWGHYDVYSTLHQHSLQTLRCVGVPCVWRMDHNGLMPVLHRQEVTYGVAGESKVHVCGDWRAWPRHWQTLGCYLGDKNMRDFFVMRGDIGGKNFLTVACL